MSIPVYILQSRTGIIGFCFRKSKDKSNIYTYGLSNLFDLGAAQGSIFIRDVLDKSFWITSVHIFSVNLADIEDYDRCIKHWASEAGEYSPFEGLGSTCKSFVAETYRILSSRDVSTLDSSIARGSLIEPVIPTRHLTYRTYTRLDNLRTVTALAWFNQMSALQYNEESYTSIVNETGYLYIVVNREHYYIIEGARVTVELTHLALPAEPSISPSIVISSQQPANNQTLVTAPGSPKTIYSLLAIVFLVTLLIVLIVLAILVVERSGETNLIGAAPISSLL